MFFGFEGVCSTVSRERCDFSLWDETKQQSSSLHLPSSSAEGGKTVADGPLKSVSFECPFFPFSQTSVGHANYPMFNFEGL